MTDETGNAHTVRFSRPTNLPIYFHIELRKFEGFDEDAVGAAMRSMLFTYVNRTLDIGEAMNIPQLYGMLCQAAGSYAPMFAITDLSVSGSHGVEREKLTPAWNQKFVLNNSTTDVTIAVSE